MLDRVAIKFGEFVWHDQPYLHPQLGTQVERDFFDRDSVKERVESMLRSTSRKPVIVIGERRSGKTSLLKLLANHLANDPSGSFVPVLIPWQGISTRDKLFGEILEGIAFELDQELPNLDQLSAPYGLTVTRYIETIRQLLMSVSNKTVIICIDEFDSIIEEAANFQEKSRIVGLATALVETNDLPIKLLLTTTRIPDIPQARSSPLFAKAELIPLLPFSKADLDEMILTLVGQQINLSAQELQRLYDLSGGWPYFAKLLLHCLAELALNQTWLEQTLTQAIIHPNIEPTLENIFDQHFSNHEKAMMLLLAKRDGQVSAEEIAIIGPALKTAADTLVERSFISRNEDGSYRFCIGFLANWFPKWPRFNGEVEIHLQDTLLRLERLHDPWTGSQPIIVTNEELKQRGYRT